jgi:hypothetical protein
MNNHDLDSLESSEALGEDDSAFDLGTSPHGLSADLPEALSNLAARSDCAPSAKPGFGVPEVFRTPQVLKDSAFIQQRAREHHYPLVLTATQMKHVQEALRVAIQDACEALEEEPHGRDDIQPDIDAYYEISLALKQAKAANKGKVNEDWRGDIL